MKVTVLYFAALREAVGCAREQLELPATVATLGDLRGWLAGRGEPWAQALADRPALRMALDQQMAHGDEYLREGAEVAFFPPVTGG